MAIFEPETRRFLCECGCGEEVADSLSKYRPGHYFRTEEGRQRQSESHSNVAKSDEHQRHINESLRQSWKDNYEERAARISEALSGLVRTPEQVENIRRARQEFCDSEEGRVWADKHSEFMTGLVLGPHSEEARLAASESNLRYWAEHPRPCGEDAPNWKGGYIGEYGYGWRAAREVILIRDGRTCQGCGQKYDLVVHHIDSDTANWGNRNLITVCRSCNGKASSKDRVEYWKEYYTSRIEEIYAALAA